MKSRVLATRDSVRVARYQEFVRAHQDGSSLGNSFPLNLDQDSVTIVKVRGIKRFVLNYESMLSKDITAKILVKSEERIKLRLSVVRRLFDSQIDSIELEAFVLTDSISSINFKAIDETRYLIIDNITPQAKTNCDVVFQIIKNDQVPLEQINPTSSRTISFSLNKYSNSSYIIVNVDSSSLNNFSIPVYLSNKIIRFQLDVYDKYLKRVQWLGVNERDNNREYAAILEKGKYFLKIQSQANQWPKDILPDTLASKKYNLQISEPTVLPPQPNSIKLLSSWLSESGLDKYFKIALYYCDSIQENSFMTPEIDAMFTTKKHELGEYRSVDNVKDSKERGRLEQFEDRLSESYSDTARAFTKTWYDRKYEPDYFIYLVPLVDKTDMSKLEDDYFEQFKTSIWYKVFDKIRLFTNVPFEKILIYVPVWCSMDWVYVSDLHNQKDIQRMGVECMSGGASSLLCNFSNLNATISTPLLAKIDIAKKAEPFLKTHIFSGSHFNLEFLDSDKYSFSVIIRNVKGYILRGDNYWEKIEIKCLIREGENGKYLQVETDGVYANGLGENPKDSQFDKSFEPAYKQNLIEFSQSFLTDFKNYLLN